MMHEYTNTGSGSGGGGRKRMERVDLRDGLIVLGLVLLAGGLGGYDWRLAAVVCGVVLLAVGLWSAGRPSP